MFRMIFIQYIYIYRYRIIRIYQYIYIYILTYSIFKDYQGLSRVKVAKQAYLWGRNHHFDLFLVFPINHLSLVRPCDRPKNLHDCSDVQPDKVLKWHCLDHMALHWLPTDLRRAQRAQVYHMERSKLEPWGMDTSQSSLQAWLAEKSWGKSCESVKSCEIFQENSNRMTGTGWKWMKNVNSMSTYFTSSWKI